MQAIHKRKITLVEILVVIALIAILVSLLFPALRKARETSRIAVCVSNQNQLGIAMYNYTIDNDNYLIYSKWVLGKDEYGETIGLGGNGIAWDDLLNPYLGGDLNTWDDKMGHLNKFDDERGIPAFICPSDRWAPVLAGGTAQSYSSNQRVLGSTNQNRDEYKIYRYEASGNNAWALTGQQKITKIDRSSQTFAITDAPNNRMNNCEQGSTHGRVELNKLWHENGALQAQLNIPYYGVDDQNNGHQYLDNVGALDLHLEKLNYLFLDGHVKTLNSYSTIGTGNMTNPKGIWSYDPND